MKENHVLFSIICYRLFIFVYISVLYPEYIIFFLNHHTPLCSVKIYCTNYLHDSLQSWTFEQIRMIKRKEEWCVKDEETPPIFRKKLIAGRTECFLDWYSLYMQWQTVNASQSAYFQYMVRNIVENVLNFRSCHFESTYSL